MGKILVVDDSKPIREYMQDLFSGIPSITVSTAENGHDALLALSQTPDFDLVFIDREMPGIDGIETIRRLRGMGFTSVYFVMVTTDIADEQRMELKALDVETILIKPVEPVVLLRLVRKYFDIQGDTVQPGKTGGGVLLSIPGIVSEAVLPGLNGNIGLFMRSLGRFYEEYKPLLAAKALVTDPEDPASLRFFLHTLKGVVSVIGAETIAETTSELHALVKAGNDPVREKYLADILLGDIKALLGNIAPLLPGPETAGAARTTQIKTTRVRDLITMITTLRSLLSCHDSDAEEAFRELQESWPGLSGSEPFSELGNLIREYEFADALRVLDSISNAADTQAGMNK